MPKRNNEIVFLGDSLTERGRWNELFQNDNVVNRGISGDTTKGVLNRLSGITSSQPSKIFLMVGVNNLGLGESVDSIATDIKDIVYKINEQSPSTKLFVQSVLPVNDKNFRSKFSNQDVTRLNAAIQDIAQKNKVAYIDLAPLTQNNLLISNYTLDGVHLTGDAYQAWKKQIETYVMN